MLKIPEVDGNLLIFAFPDRRYVTLPTRLSVTGACTGCGAFSARRNENTALKWPKVLQKCGHFLISSNLRTRLRAASQSVAPWPIWHTGVQCRYLTVETHTQAGTGTMFNKLKHPARGDLPIRGIEFVEGTGASYLHEDPAGDVGRVHVRVHFDRKLTRGALPVPDHPRPRDRAHVPRGRQPRRY